MSLMNMLRVITHLLVGLGGVNSGHTIKHWAEGALLLCIILFIQLASYYAAA